MLQGLAKTKALRQLKQIIDTKASLSGLAKTKALRQQNELRLALGMGGNAQLPTSDTDNQAKDISKLNNDLENSNIKKLGDDAGNMPIDTVVAIRSAHTSEEVRALIKPIIQQPLYNEKIGFNATISNRTLEKMLSGKATAQSADIASHLNAVANIDVLFAKAVLDKSEPEKNGDQQTLGVHKLKVKLADDKGGQLVKITVKELLNDGNRIYSVEAIEEDSVVPELTAPQGETNRLHNAIGDNNTPLENENQQENKTFELQAILNNMQSGTLTPADIDLAEIDRLIADKTPEDEAILGQIMDIIANSYQEKTQ